MSEVLHFVHEQNSVLTATSCIYIYKILYSYIHQTIPCGTTLFVDQPFIGGQFHKVNQLLPVKNPFSIMPTLSTMQFLVLWCQSLPVRNLILVMLSPPCVISFLTVCRRSRFHSLSILQ